MYRVLEATVAYATLICTFYYYYCLKLVSDNEVCWPQLVELYFERPQKDKNKHHASLALICIKRRSVTGPKNLSAAKAK